ncbi:imm11 family protein [Corallococcus terminator]
MLRFFKLSVGGRFDDPDLCMLHSLVREMGMKISWVGLGKSASAVYPADARIYMSEDSPGIKLSPLLGNTRNTLLVSSELRAVFEKHCKNEIEYLPFTLYDHRKRVYSKDYCIVNPIGTFDCLDYKASTIIWSDSDPTRAIAVQKLVLDRAKMETAPQLFRVAKDPMSYVLRYELAKEISDRRFANICWNELPMNGAAA